MVSAQMMRLERALEPHPSLLVALSGGVDSSVVAAAAHRVKGANAVAVTLKGPSLPSRDLRSAREIAQLIGIRYVELEVDQLTSGEYRANPDNRCYYCRKVEGRRLLELASELHLRSVVDGVQVDDLQTDRPGLKAMQEWGIRHPLVEANLGKLDVRALAASFGLPNHDTPSNSCLASRIVHGQPITASLLERIDLAEEYVGSLGFSRVRVRVWGDQASVEVGSGEEARLKNVDNWEKIRSHLGGLGFDPVAPGGRSAPGPLRVIA